MIKAFLLLGERLLINGLSLLLARECSGCEVDLSADSINDLIERSHALLVRLLPGSKRPLLIGFLNMTQLVTGSPQELCEKVEGSMPDSILLWVRWLNGTMG